VDRRCAELGVRAIGSPCTDDLQCQSNRCAGGTCAEGADGSTNGSSDATTDAGVVEAISVQWVKSIGGDGDDVGNAIALDEAGNVYVGGGFVGSVDFGGQTLTSDPTTSTDAFVASYTSSGVLRWCQAHDGTASSETKGVAVGGDGNVTAVGSQSEGVFLVSFTGANGSLRWSKILSGEVSSGGISGGVTADSAGNACITGDFDGSMDFGGGVFVSGEYRDAFVACYDDSGGHRWSRHLSSDSFEDGVALAFDGSDDLYVAGSILGDIDFGGGLLTTVGKWDISVLSLAGADGSHRWSFAYGGRENDISYAIGVGRQGVYVAGRFEDELDLGSGPMTAKELSACVGGYGLDGTPSWSAHLPSNKKSQIQAMAVGPRGNVFFAGAYQGTIRLGTEYLASTGATANEWDGFVGSMTHDGGVRWIMGIGSVGSANPYGLAVDASGAVYVSGRYRAVAIFGSEQLVSSGSGDIFVVKIVERDDS
jgi:hypothetical protein